MGDNPEENETGEAPPSYKEVKAAVEPEAEPEEPPQAKPKVKPKAKSKARPEAEEEPKPKALEEESKPRVAKPAKNDKVECADCGKKMNANTLRYKHVCTPPTGDEIQKEKPRKTRPPPEDKEPPVRRKRESYSPSTPRTKMLQYYREARIAQQEQKRARYRSWLGND